MGAHLQRRWDLILSCNLGGNEDNYVVDLQFNLKSDPSGLFRNWGYSGIF